MTTPSTAYTDRLCNQGDTFMRNMSFYSAFTLVLLSAGLVCYSALSLISQEPTLSVLLVFQSLNFLSSFMLLGIGLGLPLVLIASILGWGQLALLLSGNINPHLGREGFINVLKILFSKI